jgi:DNA (cytosine-5)-methyltransferase 1
MLLRSGGEDEESLLREGGEGGERPPGSGRAVRQESQHQKGLFEEGTGEESEAVLAVRQKVVLDLCCGEGGAGEGYRRAGFRVIGVDIVDHSATYPGFFVKADALEGLRLFGDRVDAVHTSPPCLAWTQGNAANDITVYPNLIAAHRAALRTLRKPWVIENVPRAPLRNPMLLCGTMFGLGATDTDGTVLRLKRHRKFESSIPLSAPRSCDHSGQVPWGGVYGGARSDRDEARNVRRGGYTPEHRVACELLGIDFMSLAGLRKSIPPAYTEWIGGQLMEYLG